MFLVSITANVAFGMTVDSNFVTSLTVVNDGRVDTCATLTGTTETDSFVRITLDAEMTIKEVSVVYRNYSKWYIVSRVIWKRKYMSNTWFMLFWKKGITAFAKSFGLNGPKEFAILKSAVNPPPLFFPLRARQIYWIFIFVVAFSHHIIRYWSSVKVGNTHRKVDKNLP